MTVSLTDYTNIINIMQKDEMREENDDHFLQ